MDTVVILPSEEGAALLATFPAARGFVADAVKHRKLNACVNAASSLLEKADVDDGFILLKLAKDYLTFIMESQILGPRRSLVVMSIQAAETSIQEVRIRLSLNISASIRSIGYDPII